MKYILLDGSNVKEVILGSDPALPGIPITERYTPEFLESLLPVEDSVEVGQNWAYDPETNTFSEPVAEEQAAEITGEA